ncbi:MAG: Nif11-like leader peptide family RiPP precursor [Burkholderiales bacterium]
MQPLYAPSAQSGSGVVVNHFIERIQMSIEALSNFRAQVNADPKLQKMVLQALSGAGEGLPSLGAKHGYSFTAEEARSLLNDTELSDFELEAVAGGGGVECFGNPGTMS